MTDPEIRDAAGARFSIEFPRKFNAGIQEHNPDGAKGLARMSHTQLISAIREEIYDLYAYLQALENNLDAENSAADMTTK